jgi:hypothetical protein
MDGMDAARDTDIVSSGTDRRVPFNAFIGLCHQMVVNFCRLFDAGVAQQYRWCA